MQRFASLAFFVLVLSSVSLVEGLWRLNKEWDRKPTLKDLAVLESAIRKIDFGSTKFPDRTFSLEKDGGTCDNLVNGCFRYGEFLMIYGPEGQQMGWNSGGVMICVECTDWKFADSAFKYETTLAMIDCFAEQFPAKAVETSVVPTEPVVSDAKEQQPINACE